MKRNYVKIGLILLTVTAIAGFGANAFAYKGMGKGGCQGAAYQAPGGGCPFYGASLSEEDQSKLDEERKAFYNSTEELRKSIYEKELELWSELAKTDTDAEKAVTLQKTLSDLRGQLDQEQISHFIRMKAIYPDFAKKFNAWNQKPSCAGRGAAGAGCSRAGTGGGCSAWQ